MDDNKILNEEEAGEVTKSSQEVADADNTISEKQVIAEDTELNQSNDVSEKEYCKSCGKELPDDCDFCPNCGKPRNKEKVVRYCSQCGNQVEAGVKFCPKCGGKILAGVGMPDSIKNATSKVKKKVDRKIMAIAGIIIIAIVIIGAVLKVVLPKVLVSTEQLLAEANYKEAYKKAGKDDKEDVLVENIIANLSGEAENNLKNPDSFKLTKAWYDDEKHYIVLNISGENGYGGTSTSYWIYTFNSEDEEYQLWSSQSDLDEEETHSWDDSNDKLEIALDNLTRDMIKNVIYEDDYEISKSCVKRINQLHDSDILSDVELIDEVKTIYPSDNDSDEI